MEIVQNRQVLKILERTLDYIDPRLIDHGKRVSYLMYQLLKDNDKFSRKQLRDICILAIIHDIGAYRTEEIDRMVRFETEEIWEHSIYGYLFLREFSPIAALAPILMFHHADCSSLSAIDESYHEIAQLLNIADRMDVFHQTAFGGKRNYHEYLELNRDLLFGSKYLDMFLSKKISYPSSTYIDGDIEYNALLNEVPFTSREIDSYLRMIVLAIDFRSYYTVTHTLYTTGISTFLAEYLNLSEQDIEIINKAALLHDIGKSGIPVEIIEAPRKLTEGEMRTMRSHVNMTEHILSGNIDARISQIAIHHHEKLNGSGYPYKLTREMISVEDSIVVTADILSALAAKRSYKQAWSKEKIVQTLTEMVEKGELDGDIVALAIRHYDEIFIRVDADAQVVLEQYEKIMREYDRLLAQIRVSKERIIEGRLEF